MALKKTAPTSTTSLGRVKPPERISPRPGPGSRADSLRFEEPLLPDHRSDDGATPRSSSILNRPVLNAEIGRRRAVLAEHRAETTLAKRGPSARVSLHHECGESHSRGVRAATIDENYLDQIYSIVANQDLLDSRCNRLRIAAQRFTALPSDEELDAALLGDVK